MFGKVLAKIIPQGSNERFAWSLNFEDEFPAVREVLGFMELEETALLAASAAMRYVILNSQAGAAFSKACRAYKNDMLGGVDENTLTPTFPDFC